MNILEWIRTKLDRLREENHLFVVQLLFFAFLCVKASDRLWFAGIWAEDGQVFLKEAFELGWSSLFVSYAGYFHTLPRLIALVSMWLPFKAIPYFIVLINYVIFTATITMLLRKQYTWLFPNSLFALLAILLLFLSPGQEEMLGNVTNLHWYLLLWLAILGLKDVDEPYSSLELLCAFLCISSEGAVIILLPLFCTRIYLKWKNNDINRLRHLSGEVLIAFAIIIFTAICFVIKPEETGTSISSDQLKVFYVYLLNFFLVHPFVGDLLLLKLQDLKILHNMLGIVFLTYLVYVWRENWQKRHILIVILVFSSLGLPVMISKARPENFGLLFEFYKYHFWFGFRYSFFVCAIAGIVWPFVLHFNCRIKALPVVLLTLLLLAQVFNLDRLPVEEYGRNGKWARRAEILEESLSTGCPQEVLVPIYPEGWMVNFVSPKQCE